MSSDWFRKATGETDGPGRSTVRADRSSGVPIIKILIICRDSVVTEGLGCLLEDRRDRRFEVVGHSDTASEGLRLAEQHAPDVAIVALRQDGPDGVQSTRQLTQTLEIPVLILSEDPDSDPLADALRAGASGCITPECDSDELIRALDAVVGGKNYLSPEAATGLVKSFTGTRTTDDPVFKRLSAREREVLQLLADGHGTQKVAEKLGISPKTVDTHRQHTMEKLGAHSVAELVKHALRAGLTSPNP